MSEQSKIYHSINIGKCNTWGSWHMVPTSRPVVNPPEVVTEYVEIPGADGALDFTEILAGRSVYKNRTGSWEFLVMNGYQEWHRLYNTLLTYLHGKAFDIVLDDEPDYVYHGRLSINEWKSEERNSKVVIDYVIEPYKKPSSGIIDDWKWDELTVSTDTYIIYYGSFEVNGTRDRVLYNPLSEPVTPSITVTDTMTLKVSGKEVFLFPGINDYDSLKLYPGENLYTFIGTGRVSINYDRGGAI